MGPTDPRIYLTLRCSLRCSYCSNGLDLARYEEMDAAAWRAWLDRYKWIRGVVFTGGEPTLHRDFFDILANALVRCSVEVYSNFHRPLDWRRLPDYGHLRWRVSCHAQTPDDARAWLRNVEAARAAGQRLTLTTVLAPNEVLEVLRPYEVCVDAPQVRPSALPPPVDCNLPRILVGPDGNRYCCVGKLTKGQADGIVDMDVMGGHICWTPDACATCDSLASERRLTSV